MSDVALRTVGLGKKYHIGAQREQYRTLRDTIAKAARRPLERLRHPGAATDASEELWALRDVDLEVNQGEVLGIIGRNGAGKSTLLKVLSHITEPTEGHVEIHGRVASLLEVGTGFHAELTGRENIQLNGAILGMTRIEIKRSFDEIVEFSGVGRFLDTPVKHYSSGMYVRLAFAVAAHLNPEVLIVDEVLSVGDAEFQKKCLGKMEEVAGGGRTVLLVSHNMQAIRSLCRTAVEIDAGRVVNAGDAAAVVADYVSQQADTVAIATWEPGEGPGDAGVRLVRVAVLGEDGEPAIHVTTKAPLRLRFEFDLAEVDPALCIGFDLVSSDGGVVLRSYQTDASREAWPDLKRGRNSIDCTLPPWLLNDGRYLVMPRISIHNVRWIVNGDSVVSFEVDRDPGGSPLLGGRPGAVAPILRWSNT
ncbi:MAG: ABC transporter ATP-binding protein [Chloroflexi bacterium]|nr:ABC transporter ATP-binding protein [Chloroflexota bacterium]